jgi:hypothetical protein
VENICEYKTKEITIPSGTVSFHMSKIFSLGSSTSTGKYCYFQSKQNLNVNHIKSHEMEGFFKKMPFT